MTILIGADPELFVYDLKGRPVSAHNLIPGSKWDPHEVTDGAVQVDGVAAEFNINPAATADEFVKNIFSVEGELIRILHRTNNELVLRATPTIKFTKKQWDLIPMDAKMLGCEPDYDAYSFKENKKPETDKFMRTGSGHIHISWGQNPDEVKKPWLEHCASLVHHLDTYLYKESLKWDSDKERLELYGRPGSFRPKPYGLEYRVLSNKWVEAEKTMRYVFETAKFCTEQWLNNMKPTFYSVKPFGI